MRIESARLFWGLVVATCVLWIPVACDTVLTVVSRERYELNPAIRAAIGVSPMLPFLLFAGYMGTNYLVWRYNRLAGIVMLAAFFGEVVAGAILHALFRVWL